MHNTDERARNRKRISETVGPRPHTVSSLGQGRVGQFHFRFVSEAGGGYMSRYGTHIFSYLDAVEGGYRYYFTLSVERCRATAQNGHGSVSCSYIYGYIAQD